MASPTCLLLLLIFSLSQSPIMAAKQQSYVVHLGRHFHVSEPSASKIGEVTESHHDILASCMTSKSKEKAKEAIFYSYTHYFNGFAATLDDDQVAQLKKHPKVVGVLPNKGRKLHTTKTWEYLGLEKDGKVPPYSLWKKTNFGENMIIGALDLGVWPESESFNDDGMGPIPSRWNGKCETNDGVKCNRKLIGAQYFSKGWEAILDHPLSSSYQTARDYDGHGTHTLSTAGGSFVRGANFFGAANGTAKGGAPKARVAMYKVCWPSCLDADILKAMETAISDGVDILSLSIGSAADEYYNDNTAVGSFYALEHGIPVVCAAGNDGPTPGIVTNVAPWILTVAASSIDRDFPSTVVLGNNKQFKGQSFKTNTLPAGKYYPLIYAAHAKAANVSDKLAKTCYFGSLDPKKVKGKIVYCVHSIYSSAEKSQWMLKAGAVGMIFVASPGNTSVTPEAYLVPASLVSAENGKAILSYILHSKSPKAYIQGGTVLGKVTAPIMADFSSPGPNSITPGILKPDITAPGVYILAAYTQAKYTSFPLSTSNFHTSYNIISGTSMACPHVSGIVSLVKAVHPDWSPSAIKSAIMTTARTRSNARHPIVNASHYEANPFNYGSGHVMPNRAVNPGLVYDLTATDYRNFICSIGYNSSTISLFIGRSHKCPKSEFSLLNFNYPSLTIPNLLGNVTLSRTLKNVGTPGSYRVRIKPPAGISIKVEPEILKFNKLYEEKTFQVTLHDKWGSSAGNGYVFGGITWSDGKHYVRSPIVVKRAHKLKD